MIKNEIPFRQIHLDFHTSEQIEDVGSEFDPKEFGETLKNANVNSINLFLRCHHGMLYYDSEKNPERVHPHLKNKNFLKEQIKACKDNGIEVHLYTPVLWDILTAKEHPEWVAITPEGKLSDYKDSGIFDASIYRNLCINSGYRDFLKEHLKEALDMFADDIDGVWLDATFIVDCCCQNCINGMKEKGLNPEDPEDRKKFHQESYQDFVREMTAFVKSYGEDMTIFYNKSHVGTVDHPIIDQYSYAAFECIPGGSWGYMDYPISVRYNRTKGLQTVGMTAKFHGAWGDFHSIKDKNALEYECFHMLAQGSKCLIGDQLLPSGKLDKHTYDLIGGVYEQVKEKEPWCSGALPVTEIGVFTPEEFYGAREGNLPPEAEGACRILQQGGHQFDFIDSKNDLSKYKVVILPDVIPVNDELARKLSDFMKKGGVVIVSYESGLNPDKTEFAVKEIGAKYLGDSEWEPDFIIPAGEMLKGLNYTQYVMYKRGKVVDPDAGTQTLCQAESPMFNRTWEHFTSHEHFPTSGKKAYSAVIKNGNMIYFMHPIFGQYNHNAPPWVKRLLLNAVDLALPNPILKHDGPSTMIATVTEQEEKNRRIVHLLHYIPERRSETMDIIEDTIPVYDVNVSLIEPKKVKNVSLVPQKENIEFKSINGRTEFKVGKIYGHQMIEIEYED